MSRLKFTPPMLAKNYEGNEHRVKFPCYVQPKMDGIRCITNGRQFWSRNGKLFPIENLKHLVVERLAELVDGELMVEGSEHFEDVVSAVKNGTTLDRSLANRIIFCAFDVIRFAAPYRSRRVTTHGCVKIAQFDGAKWRHVETVRVISPQMLEKEAKRFLKSGFEGTMVRDPKSMYEGRRSLGLLKYKPLQDAEFPIVAVKEAQGKDAGTPIFICRARPYNDEEQTFRVRPMGTMKQRRQMWKDRRKLIGEWLTVEFQNLTKHGKPRFPRAKVLRNYE